MRDILDGVLNTQKIRPVSGATQDILRCPKCGAVIPEGKLYCASCGEEIHFVPEFEPEVDESITVAMSGVASAIAAENETAARGGESSFVRREDTAKDAYFDFHVRFPKRVLRYAAIAIGIAAAAIIAALTVPRILRLEIFDGASRAREEIQTAPAPEVTAQAQDAANAPEESASAAQEPPAAPVFDHSSGRYEGELAVSVTNFSGENRYYYTTDGTQPTRESERYLAPILFAQEQEATLRMIAVAESGLESEETIAVYVIDRAAPAAPVILEESGEYTQGTMIVVVSQEGCTITYTTDGSDPEPDSAVYTAPIKMPVGNSVFRFRAFDEEGNGSEIAERTYHLAYARLVSEEQAIASVMRVLIDKHVLIDTTGKVLGAEGCNAYFVERVIEIEGAGEYYRIVERYVAPDGSVSDTGLLYAVNTNDGSVHRLGYDSSGRYTLFTLSAH